MQQTINSEQTVNSEIKERFSNFVDELFLECTPSLNLQTLDHIVHPSGYTIKESTFNALLKKYNFTLYDLCYFLLNKGPKIAIGE